MERGSINLRGVEQVAAAVALVATRIGIAAQVAGALHVAVGQEAPLGGRVPLLLALGVQVTVLLESARKMACETLK